MLRKNQNTKPPREFHPSPLGLPRNWHPRRTTGASPVAAAAPPVPSESRRSQQPRALPPQPPPLLLHRSHYVCHRALWPWRRLQKREWAVGCRRFPGALRGVASDGSSQTALPLRLAWSRPLLSASCNRGLRKGLFFEQRQVFFRRDRHSSQVGKIHLWEGGRRGEGRKGKR